MGAASAGARRVAAGAGLGLRRWRRNLRGLVHGLRMQCRAGALRSARVVRGVLAAVEGRRLRPQMPQSRRDAQAGPRVCCGRRRCARLVGDRVTQLPRRAAPGAHWARRRGRAGLGRAGLRRVRCDVACAVVDTRL